MFNTRKLLNEMIVPLEVTTSTGEKVNPLDLTRKANLYWLITNLGVANSKHPKYRQVLDSLKGLLQYATVYRHNKFR